MQPSFFVHMRGETVSSKDAFYHGSRHRHWRQLVIDRADGLCEECRRYGRTDADGLPVAATTAHHVLHADKYPELRYDVRNGRALCDACHNTAHPEKGGRRW